MTLEEMRRTQDSVLECVRMFYTGECVTFDAKYPWMAMRGMAEWNAMIICFLANAVGGHVYEGMGEA